MDDAIYEYRFLRRDTGRPLIVRHFGERTQELAVTPGFLNFIEYDQAGQVVHDGTFGKGFVEFLCQNLYPEVHRK